MYDIGLNLFDKQFKNPELIYNNALKNNIYCILTGTSIRNIEKIDGFVSTHDDCWATAGIHPHNADSYSEATTAKLREFVLKNNKFVAIGECGLDYDRMFSKKENQLSALKQQIALAEELNMPLFLHERSAFNDFYNIFKGKDICEKSVVHCFTGNIKELEKYLDIGFNIGITGWICDERRGKDLQEAIKIIPMDRLLIETDAPYLTPRNIKGLNRTNVPENIIYVARKIAEILQLSEDEIVAATTANTQRIFNIKGEKEYGGKII